MSALPVVLLMGPTAAGKSVAALELAQRFESEIVSVDSAQVYRGMDIGTAKPDAATRASVPHHLIDVVEPTQAYSAARFVADAAAAIAGIRSRGRLAIVAGGTMLYFKALVDGLSQLPAADPVLRKRLALEAAEQGWPALHGELARVDPITAARLAPADSQRIQRALEVYRSTGIPLSTLHGARASALDVLGPVLRVALVPGDRARLHETIAERFDAMLAQGLVAELEGLRSRHGLQREMTSMRAVGYRQAWAFLEGEIDAAQLRDRGIAATRQLAKRQFTWLRATEAVRFDSDRPGTRAALVDHVAAQLRAAG